MLPILYEKNETDFNHNGLGVMADCISAVATEELNGSCELKVVYDLDGPLADAIDDELIIKAKMNDKQDNQLFRIYSHEKSQEDGMITVYAQHITYDLSNNFVEKVEESNVDRDGIMKAIQNGLAYPTRFELSGQGDTTSSTKLYRTNPLQMIAGIDGSVLDNWGGEILRDNFRLAMLPQRGIDDGVLVAYKKNLTGLTVKFDLSSVVTRIYPFKQLEDGTVITLEEKYVDSTHINDYAFIRILPVDFGSDESVTDEASLRAASKNYFTDGTHKDLPDVSLEVKFESLWNTEEYKNLAVLERVGMGDTITVKNSKMGYSGKSEVIKIEFDVIAEKNLTVESGAKQSTFTESAASVADDVTKAAQQAVAAAGAVIVAANGKNHNYYSATEPVGNLVAGDLWFQIVDGDMTRMYRYDGAQWVLVVSADAADAKSSAQEALDQANAAVDKANQLSDDVGGAVDSATEAVNTANAANTASQAAQDTAANAASDAAEAKDNAAAAMTEAQKKADADSVYTKTEVDEALDAYAKVTTVNTLTGRVDSAETRITETENEIEVKADKSTVDTLTGQVSTLSTEVSTQADQIAARITKEDADAKYATQTSLKATSDGLLVNINQAQTDAQNYADSRVTQTAESLQSTITSVQSDVVGIVQGGKNLLRNTADFKNTDHWSGTVTLSNHSFYYNNNRMMMLIQGTSSHEITCSSDRFPVIPGKKYTFSMKGFMNSKVKNVEVHLLCRQAGSTNNFDGYDHVSPAFRLSTTGVSYYYCTLTASDDAAEAYIRIDNNGSTDGYNAQLFVAELKLEEGVYATPYSPAPEDIATTSQISQLSDDINLRVKKGDVINQINVSTESILIAGKKIHITGDTTFDSGVVKAQNIDVANLAALSANLGTVTAGNLKAVTITGSTITGSTIQTATSGPRIELSGNILQGYAANGSEYLRVDTTAGGALQLTRSSSAVIGNMFGGGALMLGNYDTDKWTGAGQPSFYGVGWSGDNDWLVFGNPGSLSNENGANLSIKYDNTLMLTWGLYDWIKFVEETPADEYISTGVLNFGSGTRALSNCPKIYVMGDKQLDIANADVYIKDGKAIHLGNIGINSGHTIISEDGDHFNFTNAFSNGTPVAINASAFNKVSKWGFKENFAQMDPTEALTNILNTDVVRYNYKGNPELQVGLVIDDRQQPEYHAAADFVTADREAAKTDTIVGELMLAVKALHEKNQELESRIAQLEAV